MACYVTPYSLTRLEDKLQTLQPDDDDEKARAKADINDIDTEDDTAAAGDECHRECSGNSTRKYNWSRVKELFALEPRDLEFYAIGFALTTPTELAQLPVPKHDAGAHLYTAAYFCRTGPDWFIYRVIFALKRLVTSEELPGIYKRLVNGAYFELSVRRRTKHPVMYLRNIVL